MTINTPENILTLFGRSLIQSLMDLEQGNSEVLPGAYSLKQLRAEKHMQDVINF